jgi:fucose permease
MLIADIAGVQALTFAIPLGTFLVVLFLAFFQRRSTR